MRVSITVYTTRKAEYRMRKLGRWIRERVFPAAALITKGIAYAGAAFAIFFACGMDSRELAPVVQGFLVSLMVTAGAGSISWLIGR